MAIVFSIHGYHFRKIFAAFQKRSQNLIEDSQARIANMASNAGQSPVLVTRSDTNEQSSEPIARFQDKED